MCAALQSDTSRKSNASLTCQKVSFGQVLIEAFINVFFICDVCLQQFLSKRCYELQHRYLLDPGWGVGRQASQTLEGSFSVLSKQGMHSLSPIAQSCARFLIYFKFRTSQKLNNRKSRITGLVRRYKFKGSPSKCSVSHGNGQLT